MSNYISDNNGNLFDPVTRRFVGIIDQWGGEQLIPTAISNPVTGGTEYAGRVFITANPDDGTVDQTAVVQAVINGCKPGQTAVLPPPTSATARYVKCGAIKIPSGVHLESAGSSPYLWTVSFGPSLSQAFNTCLKNIWFKTCKFLIQGTPDNGTATSGAANALTDTSKSWGANQWAGWKVKITSGTGAGQTKWIASNSGTTLVPTTAFSTAPDSTSVYELSCNISAVVFDNCQLDGTYTDNSSSVAGDAVTIGQFGFDIKFVNGTQTWNYQGWGLTVNGNSDPVANTGTPYLATGVFVCLSDTKIFNCGGSGSGGAIRLMGGPQDGSSLHLSNVLLDHCQYALYVDDSVSGVPANGPANSGGITVFGNNVRIESCGRYPDADGATETPVIYNSRGNITINGLWGSQQGIATASYYHCRHRYGTFRVVGGKYLTHSGTYAVFCDPGQVAVFDLERNQTNNMLAGKEVLTATEDAGAELQVFRFRIQKGASGITVTCSSGNGFGWGLGGTAGDRASSTTSSELALGGTTTVGSNYTQMTYTLGAVGGVVQISQQYKSYAKVLFAVMEKQTASLSNIYVDCQLLNASANFSLIFNDATGTEKNLISSMTTGQYIDVAVGIAVLR